MHSEEAAGEKQTDEYSINNCTGNLHGKCLVASLERTPGHDGLAIETLGLTRGRGHS